MTPTAVPPEHELAERAYRLAAVLFDATLVLAIQVAAMFAGVVIGALLPDLLFMVQSLVLLMQLAGWSVLGLVQWGLLASDGTTLGKRVVGIRIVRNGLPPGFVMGVLVRRIAPRLLMVPTLGLSLLADLVPMFTPDRRCVHDRIADTYVVLDPQAREGDLPIGGQELWVRRGVGFAHVLAVSSLAVAGLFAAIALQNVVTGLSGLTGGWFGTAAALGWALALLVVGAVVYDGRPVAVVAVVVVSAGAMLSAGLWFASLFMFYGAVSPLPWIAGAAAGALGLVAGLFVVPSSRIAVARQALHEQAMLEEFALGAPAGG